jgi:hypothetical protein
MTFELFSSAGLVAFVGVVVLASLVGLALAAVAAVDTVTTHRPVRRARHQSVPAYYRGLLTSH